ncbi:50S ribosomal protein L29 [bacterium]|nr:50S ribosomal protein L29 [bacterium]QQR57603.1 MAG: 50S ribosomal protein L29 [Candidatus Melainabacteria bacterium]
MKIKEMRDLSQEELNTQVADTRKEIVSLRFAHSLRKLESTAKLRQTKKRLAQLLTIITEKADKSEKKVSKGSK